MAAPIKIKAHGWVLLPAAVLLLIYQVLNIGVDPRGLGILDTAILPILTIAAIVCAVIFSGKKLFFYLSLAGAYFFPNLAVLVLYARTEFSFGIDWLFKVVLGNFLPVNYLFWSEWEYMILLLDLVIILLIVSLVLSFFDRSSTTAPKKSTSPAVVNSPKRTQQTGAQIEGDAVAQIEKLGDLLKKGLITQGEFESKKKQILGI